MAGETFSYTFRLHLVDVIRAYALIKSRRWPVYVAATIALFLLVLAFSAYRRGGVSGIASTFEGLFTGQAGLVAYGLVAGPIVFAGTSHWFFAVLYALFLKFTPLLNQSTDVAFSDEGIFLTARGISSTLEWSSLVEARSNGAVLVCRLWTGQLLIVPRRVAESGEAFGALVALVREKTQRI